MPLIERESRLYLPNPRFQCNFDWLCFDSIYSWKKEIEELSLSHNCFYLPRTCLIKIENEALVSASDRLSLCAYQINRTDLGKVLLKSHVVAPCAAASHAIFIACNKNRTDQTRSILSHAFVLRHKGVRLWCNTIIATTNHRRVKSHDKWNMATSGGCVDVILNKIAGYRHVWDFECRPCMERRKQNLMRSCNCRVLQLIPLGTSLRLKAYFCWLIAQNIARQVARGAFTLCNTSKIRCQLDSTSCNACCNQSEVSCRLSMYRGVSAHMRSSRVF